MHRIKLIKKVFDKMALLSIGSRPVMNTNYLTFTLLLVLSLSKLARERYRTWKSIWGRVTSSDTFVIEVSSCNMFTYIVLEFLLQFGSH